MAQKVDQVPHDWTEAVFTHLSFRDRARVRDWALKNMRTSMTMREKNTAIFHRLHTLASARGLLDVFYNERHFAQLITTNVLSLE